MNLKISREEAEDFAERQLDFKTPYSKKPKAGGQWHYGRAEIRELLDHIYGPKKQE